MTNLLKKAFEEASKLPPEEQDAIASALLAELRAERAWARTLSESQEVLERLSREALSEYERGGTKDLDPSNL